MERDGRIIIVPMSAENIADLADIERECFSMPWSAEMLREELFNDCASYIVAQDEKSGEVVGYAGLLVAADEGYITNVAVREKCRRFHIASRLMDVFMNFCEANDLAFITLEVRRSNVSAIALYEKYGFSEAGVRKNYYDAPKEDALIMTRWFSKEAVKC
ncbi:MAG: ribosomal protein S18-alanine N-acetyltransferase [Oscillospiraceae bacterium]|nr:ribosomal protein S18-alanine N-acetyltransferase [Oscillospiraceae bacterium]